MISLVTGVTQCSNFSGMSRVSLHALSHTGAELAVVASHGLVCPTWALWPNKAQDSLGAEQGLADALELDATEGSGNAAGR